MEISQAHILMNIVYQELVISHAGSIEQILNILEKNSKVCKKWSSILKSREFWVMVLRRMGLRAPNPIQPSSETSLYNGLFQIKTAKYPGSVIASWGHVLVSAVGKEDKFFHVFSSNDGTNSYSAKCCLYFTKRFMIKRTDDLIKIYFMTPKKLVLKDKLAGAYLTRAETVYGLIIRVMRVGAHHFYVLGKRKLIHFATTRNCIGMGWLGFYRRAGLFSYMTGREISLPVELKTLLESRNVLGISNIATHVDCVSMRDGGWKILDTRTWKVIWTLTDYFCVRENFVIYGKNVLDVFTGKCLYTNEKGIKALTLNDERSGYIIYLDGRRHERP